MQHLTFSASKATAFRQPHSWIQRALPVPVYSQHGRRFSSGTAKLRRQPVEPTKYKQNDYSWLPTTESVSYWYPSPPPLHHVMDAIIVELDTAEGQDVMHKASAQWVGEITRQLWPWVAQMVEDGMRQLLPAVLEEAKPQWMEGVKIAHLELGNVSPVYHSLKVLPEAGRGVGVRGACMVLDVEWKSKSNVQLEVRPLPAKLTSALGERVGKVVGDYASFQAGVTDIAMRAQLHVALGPAQAHAPVVRMIQISLLNTPEQLDFHITLSKEQVHWLDVVQPWVRGVLQDSLQALVLPERVVIPLQQEPLRMCSHMPEGVLQVRVLQGQHLPQRDSFQAQPRVSVRASVRHRVKHDTAAVDMSQDGTADWSSDSAATFALLVHSPEHQQLTLDLVEHDTAMLGPKRHITHTRCKALLPVSVLKPSQQHTHTLQLRDHTLGSLGPVMPEAAAAALAAAAAVASKGTAANARTKSPQDAGPAEQPSLQVQLEYIPYGEAHKRGLHRSGMLSLVLDKVVLPSSDMLPLQLRPTLDGVPPPNMPSMSPPLVAVQASHDGSPGEGGSSSSSSSSSIEARSGWEALWDVVVPAGIHASSQQPLVLKLELVAPDSTAAKAATSAAEAAADATGQPASEQRPTDLVTIASSVVTDALGTASELEQWDKGAAAWAELPLSRVMQQMVPGLPGVWGGEYQVVANNGAVLHLMASWHPLVPPAEDMQVEATTGMDTGMKGVD